MKSMKKVLCILLSVAMLAGCLVFSVSAAPADGKEVAYKLVADKETYNPGDTITFTLYVDVRDFDVAYGAGAFYFSYDSKVLAPEVTNREFVGDMIYKPAGPVTSSAAVHNAIAAALAETGEDALYDASFVVAGIWDTATGIPSAQGFKFTSADTPQITFQMKVLEDAAPGTTSALAITQGAINTPLRMYLKHPDNTKVASEDYDLSQATANFTIASDEPAGPAVAKAKSQVKMTPTSASTVADEFQFRVTSVITDADWDTYFANTGTAEATTNAITALGFVAYKGTEGFDLETAKAVAKGDQLPNESYYAATTDYVQKADDASAAYFGAVVDITSAETRSDATYIAFVEYLDADGATQYAFYDAAGTALLNTNYDTIVRDYLKAFPFAG